MLNRKTVVDRLEEAGRAFGEAMLIADLALKDLVSVTCEVTDDLLDDAEHVVRELEMFVAGYEATGVN